MLSELLVVQIVQNMIRWLVLTYVVWPTIDAVGKTGFLYFGGRLAL